MPIPSDFSGLTGWWHADSESYTADAAVDTFHDRTGLGGRDLTEATASKKPSFLAAATPSGLPALRFDGVDDRLTSVATLANFISASAYTMYAYARFNAVVLNNVAPSQHDNDVLVESDPVGIGLVARANAGDPRLISVLGNAVGTKLSAEKAFRVGEWIAVCGQLSSGVIWSFVDSFVTSSGASAAAANVGNLTYILRFGGHVTTQFAKVDIAEVIIYDVAHDEGQRTAIQQFFDLKYRQVALAEAARNVASRRLRLVGRPIPIIQARTRRAA